MNNDHYLAYRRKNHETLLTGYESSETISNENDHGTKIHFLKLIKIVDGLDSV